MLAKMNKILMICCISFIIFSAFIIVSATYFKIYYSHVGMDEIFFIIWQAI